MRTLAALLAVSTLALSAATPDQQRDAPIVPAGTGAITGVVVSADDPAQPVRRVVVSIAGGGLPAHRSVITDDAGRFAFARLPAGEFSVTAKKPAWLATEHGSPRPGRTGSRIALAEGERRTISLAIHRGAVIAGTLRDPSGAPLSGVAVTAMPRTEPIGPDGRPARSGQPGPTAGTATTDDRGNFRIYGLMPGEYVVSVTPAPGGVGEIGARTTEDIDAVLAALAQRQNRTGVTAPPSLPPPPPSIGYSPIYFPGTPRYRDAAPVRLSVGQSREDVSFVAGHVPVASIEGTVTGPIPNLSAAQLAIIPDAPRQTGAPFPGALGITSQAPNTAGEFKYGNLAPGRYRIVARARASGEPEGASGVSVTVSGGLRGGAPPAGVNIRPTGEMLYAVTEVDVNGVDLAGITLALQPGGTLAGKIVFDAETAPLPDDVTGIRIGLYQFGGSWVSSSGSTRVGNALGSIQAVNVNDDGTFTVNGIGPDLYYVNAQVPAPLNSVWKMRTAMVDGRDLLDTYVQGPAVQLRDVVITLSDRRTRLSGSLLTSSGQAAPDYYVIAFSTDRASWRPGGRRLAAARPATDGRFEFDDLPAGEYFLAALTDLDQGDLYDPEFLAQVTPSAVKLRLAEGEKKVQDLRIR